MADDPKTNPAKPKPIEGPPPRDPDAVQTKDKRDLIRTK